MFVIGSAGHVDHGKTRLIKALTGMDTDRLPEEKRRGMTIDLGFAHFLDQGTAIGVIDVPGHERFIRNMVAGAWGLDCALLNVAADDGWKQQSTDHTRVLKLMDVARLILVITKTDLVSGERAENVRQEALENCRSLGYTDPPSILVSAENGQNIDRLKGLIVEELTFLERGKQPDKRQRAYLYVDRVFSVKGAGTVVTGTLRGGPLAQEQELELLPLGRKLRVRKIQTYHEDVDRVLPVCRVALNLHGLKKYTIRRGDCLVQAGSPFRSARELIIRINPAEQSAPALKNHGEIEVALGTVHRIVRIDLLDTTMARIVCPSALPVCWNQPILLIQQGGSTILGGGRVVWLGPTDRPERRKLLSALAKMPATLGEEEALGLELALRGLARRREPSVAAGSGTVAMGNWFFDRNQLLDWEKRIVRLAGQSGGIGTIELESQIDLNREILELITERLRQAGSVQLRNGFLFSGINPEQNLSPMAREMLSRAKASDGNYLELNKLKIGGAQKCLRELSRTGLLVSLDGNIYFTRGRYDQLLAEILEGHRVEDQFTIAQAKQRSGLSRKYIIPLLNAMERDGYVKRTGDLRQVVRSI